MAAAGATGRRLACEESVGLARAEVAELLADHSDVDGIVCVSDSLAIGAHLAAAAAGRADLPIVGFDNTPAVEAIGLSSVEQLPERVAAGTPRAGSDRDPPFTTLSMRMPIGD